MNRIPVFTIVAGLLIAVVLSAGCSSTPASRFYALGSANTPEDFKNQRIKDSGIIAVGPIRIPEYLDRPQIVTRSGNSELTMAEFHRWGGSLDNDLKRVIPENIAQKLDSMGYLVVNWPIPGEGNLPVQYQIVIDILQFEGTLGGSVTLKCQWGIMGDGEKARKAVRVSLITEPVQGQEYEHLVAAMSNAIARLSSEIADVVRELPRPASPQ